MRLYKCIPGFSKAFYIPTGKNNHHSPLPHQQLYAHSVFTTNSTGTIVTIVHISIITQGSDKVMLAHQGPIELVWFMWTIVLNHSHDDLWRREELVCPWWFWGTGHSCSFSPFCLFLLNHKLFERHPVHLSIICTFIHTHFPPLSSSYYLRRTNPLFHLSFSSPFRWKLDSHSFWQWHIAAVWHHIPSTQHNVLNDSPSVCLPLHLSFPLFIHPASTFSRWPAPSLPPRVPTIARLHHFICLSLSGRLAS